MFKRFGIESKESKCKHDLVRFWTHGNTISFDISLSSKEVSISSTTKNCKAEAPGALPLSLPFIPTSFFYCSPRLVEIVIFFPEGRFLPRAPSCTDDHNVNS